MNKPKFTKRHYEAIYKHNEKVIQELSTLLNEEDVSNEDQRNKDILNGIKYAHDMLGKLFYEDNPNFNPEKWKWTDSVNI
tara:strand:+ start:260 stop:499 length:240 start_codon:yes stop_codon:yes gene_type:complete